MAVIVRKIEATTSAIAEVGVEYHASHPLGRGVRHDDRSREFPHQPRRSGQRLPVQHIPTIGILNQLAQGSCVGHAGTKACSCHKVVDGLPTPKPILDHPYAVALYSACEVRDGGKGLPSEDEGTSGVTCGNELKARGVISGFTHTFSIVAYLDALQESPVMTGIDWYTGGDNPDVHGIIKATVGSIRGGHEILGDEFVPAGYPLGGGATRADSTPFGDGFIATEDMVGFDNSWGEGYGYRGRMYISVADLTKLLKAQGDGTILIAANQPAPVPTPPPPPSPVGYSFLVTDAAAVAEIHKLASSHNESPTEYLNHKFGGGW